MKSRLVLVVGIASLALLALGQSALGATRAGNACFGSPNFQEETVFGIKNPAGPLPVAIPTAGVITSWTLGIEAYPAPEPQRVNLKGTLKVLRLTEGLAGGTIIGESNPTQISFSATVPERTTAPTRIPVQAGDLLGDELTIGAAGGGAEEFGLTCSVQNEETKSGSVKGSPKVGEEATFEALSPGNGTEFAAGVPVTVVVEPDADGDGFGDLTQDASPGDPFVHAACGSTRRPCPRPFASPLRSRAVAHAEAVTVSVTTSIASTVKATGRLQLGKRTLTLTSKAKRAEVGKPSKFKLAFPPALRARLAQMSPKSSLKVEVLVTSPGLEPAKPLTVKLPGQSSGG